MRINHNISAAHSYNAFVENQAELQNTIRRLSTGLRINAAADDAAGLALSEKMESQIRGLGRAFQNAQDGISMIQTADGALNSLHSILHRMRELSVQAANDTLTAADRQFVQLEIDALKEEIDRIASTTQFNKKRLLDGSFNFLGSSSDKFVSLVQSESALLSSTNVSGNYKISVNAKAGEAEILKSTIFYAINGTKSLPNDVHYTDQDKTNIRDVGAINMAAGEYSLETREVPYGGTIFLVNGVPVQNASDYAATHGVTSLIAPGISAEGDMVPYGEYYFRATDTVPFMATYALNPDGSGAVASVGTPTGGTFQSQSTLPPSNGVYGDRAVNATMNFAADVASVSREDVLLWNTSNSITNDNLLGASSLLTKRSDYDDLNMFTTFDVYVYDRWRVADSVYGSYAYTNGGTSIASYNFTITANGKTLTGGEDIEQVLDFLSGSWVGNAPDYISQTTGQVTYTLPEMTITMNGTDPSNEVNSGQARTDAWNRLLSSIDAYFGTSFSAASNPTAADTSYSQTFSGGGTLTTAQVDARDRIAVSASYEGVKTDGTYVSGSQYNAQWIGFGKAIEFADANIAYEKINFVNLVTSGSMGSPPANPAGNPPVNTSVSTNWGGSGSYFDFATYTSPEVSGLVDVITSRTAIQNSSRTGNPASPDFTGDNNYVWPEIDYVFSADVLDGRTMGTDSGEIRLPQLYRGNYGYTYPNGDTYNVGTQRNSLYHNFTVGEFQTAENAVIYAFRASSDPVTEDNYVFDPKAKAFYGEETTYYFYEAGDRGLKNENGDDEYFLGIEVWAQENSNAALAFRYLGLDSAGNHLFNVGVKGYEADGTAFDYEVKGLAVSPNPGERLAIGSGLGSINFDVFDMNWDKLTIGDAFVVNVAAAAFADPAIALNSLDLARFADFSWGTDVVASSGNPMGYENMGATSEYRFIDGVNKGETIELLSYFVHPLDGADEELGIQKQGFEIAFASTGLVPQQGTKAGALTRTTTDAYAYAGPPDLNIGKTIFVEVNSVGSSDPRASAVVGSYFFHELTKVHEKAMGVTDFIRRVEYEATQEWNGSLLFDVVDVVGNGVRFRVQGHLYDGDGNYRYVEDHDFWLYPGDNKNLLLFEGDRYEGLQPVSSFEGLLFNTIELADDINLFTVGDRFTLSLAADAREDGKPLSDWDELNLTSDGLGTGYPLRWRFRDGVLNNATTELKLFQVDSKPLSPNGADVRSNTVMDGAFYLTVDNFHTASDFNKDSDTGDTKVGSTEIGSKTPRSVKSAAEFSVNEAKSFDARLAHYYTQLKDIKNFYDASGNFLLSTPQQLEIRQGNERVSITIHGDMEVKDLVEGIGDALYRMGGQYLMEKFPGGMLFLSDDSVGKEHAAGFHDETHLAEWFNWERRESSYETVPGTFVVRSYKAGAGGEYRFLASDELLDALAFVTIQNSKENTYDVFSQDAHSGTVITFATVQSGDTADVLLGDTALKFDSASGVKQIVYDEKTGKYDFEMENDQKVFVHVSANDAALQIGANEGEKLNMRLRNMSSSSLGLDRLYVTDAESAKRAISTLDKAIGSVSSMRAMLGAYQNRLEHTVSNLSVAQTNMISSKSRITDADYAVEMMNFTKLSILTQSDMAIMTQARAIPENILSLFR